jgi:hypothetical protein
VFLQNCEVSLIFSGKGKGKPGIQLCKKIIRGKIFFLSDVQISCNQLPVDQPSQAMASGQRKDMGMKSEGEAAALTFSSHADIIKIRCVQL